MKRWIALFLVLALLCSCALAEPVETISGIAVPEALDIGNHTVRVLRQNGRVTFMDGACTSDPVRSMEDASRLLDTVIPIMGGDSRTHFEPWRVLRDASGNQYYVFQQTWADTIVLGGALKVITDADGTMLGLTGCIETELPETEASDGLTAVQAEDAVIAHEAAAGKHPEIVTGMTRRVVLPVDRYLDLEADEIHTRFVWAVYTTNPSASISDGVDLPYMAHYVTMYGEYLYCLPTMLPGDAVGEAGYNAHYIFQFMEPVDYVGYVDWSDGTEHEISITLMRDTRTGMYYLGNIERKIVVADCWEFLYNNGSLVLEYSPDNREWDQVSLKTLYNYCRAYDYYKEIGWLGGDGEETPILILKDFCDSNHVPIDNAAYASKFYGWQCFLSSTINDFSQCLDVCAHEFTHCVTDAVMTHNAYLNDYGAINEAISDIQGNLCEMLMNDTADTTWKIGEHSLTPVRSMSNPHQFHQPEASWDLYYQARVKTPTDMNDRGGVHTNSSLLNLIAYELCASGGMTLEEARAYWFAVDCSMVPGTDFEQLRELLPWVLNNTGLGQYQDTLAGTIEATRLGDSTLPETLNENQALLTLNLPDTEVFNDGNWSLSLFNVNFEKAVEKALWLFGKLKQKDYSEFPAALRNLLENDQEHPAEPEPQKSFWELFLDELVRATEEQEAEPQQTSLDLLADIPEAEAEELRVWIRNQLDGIIHYGTGSAGQDGHTIHIMSQPGRTVPLLFYMQIEPNSMQLSQIKIVLYLNQHWFDFTEFMTSISESIDSDDADQEAAILNSPLFQEFMDALFSGDGLTGILDLFTLNIPGGTVTEIPSTGLESIVFSEEPLPSFMETTEEQAEVVHTKSRPKPAEEQE